MIVQLLRQKTPRVKNPWVPTQHRGSLNTY